MLLIFNLLQSGYYTTEPVASRYDAATMGMFVLIIVIGVIGYIVQARLQHVFKKYSEVPFPGGLTGAEVAEKMLRDNKIHNVKITHVSAAGTHRAGLLAYGNVRHHHRPGDPGLHAE